MREQGTRSTVDVRSLNVADPSTLEPRTVCILKKEENSIPRVVCVRNSSLIVF